MPLDMGARLSRRQLLLASAGVAGATLAGHLVPGLGALASGTALGGGGGGSKMCLGAALFEATQHGDETLVLPAVPRDRPDGSGSWRRHWATSAISPHGHVRPLRNATWSHAKTPA